MWFTTALIGSLVAGDELRTDTPWGLATASMLLGAGAVFAVGVGRVAVRWLGGTPLFPADAVGQHGPTEPFPTPADRASVAAAQVSGSIGGSNTTEGDAAPPVPAVGEESETPLDPNLLGVSPFTNTTGSGIPQVDPVAIDAAEQDRASAEAPVDVSGDLLEALRERTEQGRKGERYVWKVLRPFKDEGYRCDEGLIIDKALAGEHIGDVDFLIECPETGASAVIEVKTSDPRYWQYREGPYGPGSPQWQVSRAAAAVQRISAGRLKPVPIVAYVDPHKKAEGRNKATRVRFSPPEAGYSAHQVRSVGAWRLEAVLRRVLEAEGTPELADGSVSVRRRGSAS